MSGVVDNYKNVRLIDRTGRKILPIGYDSWERIASDYVLVDKTMLIADLLESGYKATLFCRPRRFGKSINMSMLRAFFELRLDRTSSVEQGNLFEGTQIWDASDGAYCVHRGAYPVAYFNLNSAKKGMWA